MGNSSGVCRQVWQGLALLRTEELCALKNCSESEPQLPHFLTHLLKFVCPFCAKHWTISGQGG